MPARYESLAVFVGSHGSRVTGANAPSDVRALRGASGFCRDARSTRCHANTRVDAKGYKSTETFPIVLRNPLPKRVTRFTRCLREMLNIARHELAHSLRHFSPSTSFERHVEAKLCTLIGNSDEQYRGAVTVCDGTR